MKAPVVLLDVFDTWERAFRMATRYVKSTNNKDKYLVKRVAPNQWAIFLKPRHVRDGRDHAPTGEDDDRAMSGDGPDCVCDACTQATVREATWIGVVVNPKRERCKRCGRPRAECDHAYDVWNG